MPRARYPASDEPSSLELEIGTLRALLQTPVGTAPSARAGRTHGMPEATTPPLNRQPEADAPCADGSEPPTARRRADPP